MNTNISEKTFPFGIRCTRDGTGRLSPAVAWFKELGVIQRFPTLAAADAEAQKLSRSALPCCRYEARAFDAGLGEPPAAPVMAMPAGPEPTTAEFMKFASDHKGLAEAVLQAKAFAELERERVRKYIQPIFDTFGFVDEEGHRIANSDGLYLCEDEARVQEFYSRADEAHRANGFSGPAGVWPDLEAEGLHIYAENALIEAAAKFFRIQRRPVGKKREQFVKLLLSACINVPNGGASAGSK